jgi:hypothetical protein
VVFAYLTVVNAVAGVRKRREETRGSDAGSGEGCTHALTKMLEATLFRQENEAIAQAQDGKRRTCSETEIAAELAGDG